MTNLGELHGVIDADDGVLHAMNQEYGGVTPDKLSLVHQTGSLVNPQDLRMIGGTKIFARLELV